MGSTRIDFDIQTQLLNVQVSGLNTEPLLN